MKLFDDNWGVDNSPIEDVEITTTILYFSSTGIKSNLKTYAKKVFRQEFGREHTSKKAT